MLASKLLGTHSPSELDRLNFPRDCELFQFKDSDFFMDRGGIGGGGPVRGGLVVGGPVRGGLVEGGPIMGLLVEGGTMRGCLVKGGPIVGFLVEGGTMSGCLVEGGVARVKDRLVGAGDRPVDERSGLKVELLLGTCRSGRRGLELSGEGGRLGAIFLVSPTSSAVQ